MAFAVTQDLVEDAITRAISPVSVGIVSSEGVRYLPIGEVGPGQEVIIGYRDYEEIVERVCAELAERNYLTPVFDLNAIVGRMLRGWPMRLKSRYKRDNPSKILGEIYAMLSEGGMLREYAPDLQTDRAVS